MAHRNLTAQASKLSNFILQRNFLFFARMLCSEQSTFHGQASDRVWSFPNCSFKASRRKFVFISAFGRKSETLRKGDMCIFSLGSVLNIFTICALERYGTPTIQSWRSTFFVKGIRNEIRELCSAFSSRERFQIRSKVCANRRSSWAARTRSSHWEAGRQTLLFDPFPYRHSDSFKTFIKNSPKVHQFLILRLLNKLMPS